MDPPPPKRARTQQQPTAADAPQPVRESTPRSESRDGTAHSKDLQQRLSNAAAAARNREASVPLPLRPQSRDTAPDGRQSQAAAESGDPAPGGMGARARRSLRRRSPRVLSPADPRAPVDADDDDDDDDDDDESTLLRRGPRRSAGIFPLASGGSPQPEQEGTPVREGAESTEHDELPPTPLQPGREWPPPPPAGIHKGVPPLRDTRSRKPAQSQASASAAARNNRPPRRTKKATAGPRKTIGYWDEQNPDARQNLRVENGTGAHDFSPHEDRHVKASDGTEALRAERDRLRDQLEALKQDRILAEKEEERLGRYLQKSGSASPRHMDGLFELMARHLLPPERQQASESSGLLDAALDPIVFLPFAGVPSLLEAAPAEADDDNMAEPPAPVSHRPIEMAAEEELPFLRLLSPFHLRHSSTLLPRTSDVDPLLLLRTVTLTSAAPPGAFKARIELTVDASTLTVAKLAFPHVEPAAAAELAPFLRGLCEPGCTRGRLHNVTLAACAMGEWLRVARERAVFWSALEQEVGTEQGVVDVAAWMRGGGRRSSAKRRAHTPLFVGDDEDKTRSGAEAGDDGDGAVGRGSDILSYMGRTAMEVRVPASTVGRDREAGDAFVRMQWNIQFDWTGTARSEVSVLTGLPGKWAHADEQNSFCGVSRIWTDMIRGGTKPATATRTIIALLAGD